MGNVPAYQTKRITYGPGILYYGAVGVTPTYDIGAVKGDATLTIKREPLEIEQGSPKTLIQQYVTREVVELKLTGIEWNPLTLAKVLGAGVTTDTGGVESIAFGGDQAIANMALLYRHVAADGSTIDIELYNAQGNGGIEVAVKESDVHEFPYTFRALEGTTNFANAALAAKQKYFKIKRQKAA